MTDTKVGYRGGYEQKEREGEMKDMKNLIDGLSKIINYSGARMGWDDKEKELLIESKQIVEDYESLKMLRAETLEKQKKHIENSDRRHDKIMAALDKTKNTVKQINSDDLVEKIMKVIDIVGTSRYLSMSAEIRKLLQRER